MAKTNWYVKIEEEDKDKRFSAASRRNDTWRRIDKMAKLYESGVRF